MWRCGADGERRISVIPRNGKPWPKPYVESFGGRLRDECLGVELFATMLEARVVIEDWRIDYNFYRPEGSGSRGAPIPVHRPVRLLKMSNPLEPKLSPAEYSACLT